MPTTTSTGYLIERDGRFVGFDEMGVYLTDDRAEAYVYRTFAGADLEAASWNDDDFETYRVVPR